MVAKKGGNKGGGISEDAEEDLARVPLQAIVLADSFTTKFRPITLERPKGSLFSGVYGQSEMPENLAFRLFPCPFFAVIFMASLQALAKIQGDFVLVSGDTISNMSLTEALQEHKDRRKKDPNAVMTMVVKQSKPSQVTRQSRLGTDELIMAIDPDTKQLLYYEVIADHVRAVSLDRGLIAENPSIFLHNDKQVEIVMTLEEKFEVSIGEDGAQNIAIVQDAADLIEKVKADSAQGLNKSSKFLVNRLRHVKST